MEPMRGADAAVPSAKVSGVTAKSAQAIAAESGLATTPQQTTVPAVAAPVGATMPAATATVAAASQPAAPSSQPSRTVQYVAPTVSHVQPVPLLTPEEQLERRYRSIMLSVEEIGRDIKPAYAGSRVAMERLKKSISQGRALVKETSQDARKVANSS